MIRLYKKILIKPMLCSSTVIAALPKMEGDKVLAMHSYRRIFIFQNEVERIIFMKKNF